MVFYGISGLAVLVVIISFVNALSWVNKPFPGILIYEFPRVGSMGSTDWPGVKAGLKLMDRIVSANERPVREGKDVVDLARGFSPGTPIRYSIETGGQIRNVSFLTAKFTGMDFFLVFFLPFLGGVAVFCIGFIVYVLKPNVSSSWVFFSFCLVVGIYMATGFEMQSTYLFAPLHYLVIPFQGAILLHLGLIFPEKRRFLTRHPGLVYAIYLPAFVLAFLFELQLFTFLRAPSSQLLRWMPDIKEITALTRIFIVLGVIGFIISVFYSMYKASSNVFKQRAKMILFGVSLAFFPVVTVFLVVHFMKISFPINFMIFFVLSFPASMAYAIIRHNLFDADTIIKRTVGYVVVTATIVGAYVLVSTFLNVLLGKYEIAQSEAFPVVFTLAIILIFNPLRNRIQRFIDRIFYRLEYDYQETVQRISETMRSLLSLDQIGKSIMDTASGTMFIDSGRLLLLNPQKQVFECLTARDKEPAFGGAKSSLINLAAGNEQNHPEQIGDRQVGHKEESEDSVYIESKLPADDPLIQRLAERKKEVTRYDIQEDPSFKKGREAYKKAFDRLGATLIVPLIYEDRLSGFLSLGDKKSGKIYRREDINLLKTMANQGAVAIENAKRADQMKKEEGVRANLARYLSPQIVDQIIKKDVQVNLGGDKKVVTVLFSDIRNFTRISETLPPDQLVRLLNEYFTEMARIIFENHGSLDKYIGDAIVAVFGSLIALENPARTAVQAAIQMMKSLSSLNERWTSEYGFAINIGIGINTGEVFLGNIGSPERMEFTVIGDTVNIASRFSGVARPGQILITKETLKCLDSEIQYRQLPPVEVKGKTGKLEVFEMIYS